jgi:hypothetical protein
MDPVVKLGRLVWPALVSLLCIALALLPGNWIASVPIEPLLKTLSKWPALSWLELVHHDGQTNYIPVRLALGVSAVFFLVYLGVRDYSQLFPQRFNVKVYFDNDGVTEALQNFDSREIATLNLPKDWKAAKEEYFDNLNSKLADAGFSFRFSHLDGSTSGSGTGIVVKAHLVERWGLQKYKISEGSGELTFVTPVPNKEPIQLTTKYKLSDSRANHFEVSLFDIYMMKPIVIMPEFKQMIHRTAEAKGEFDHILRTVTKIKFLPVLDIGTTIYMLKLADRAHIPIGYAVYEPES